jgi:hypothetical protein
MREIYAGTRPKNRRRRGSEIPEVAQGSFNGNSFPLANPADVAAIRNIDGWIKDSLQNSVKEFMD